MVAHVWFQYFVGWSTRRLSSRLALATKEILPPKPNQNEKQKLNRQRSLHEHLANLLLLRLSGCKYHILCTQKMLLILPWALICDLETHFISQSTGTRNKTRFLADLRKCNLILLQFAMAVRFSHTLQSSLLVNKLKLSLGQNCSNAKRKHCSVKSPWNEMERTLNIFQHAPLLLNQACVPVFSCNEGFCTGRLIRRVWADMVGNRSPLPFSKYVRVARVVNASWKLHCSYVMCRVWHSGYLNSLFGHYGIHGRYYVTLGSDSLGGLC